MWCVACERVLPSSYFYDHARVRYPRCTVCHNAMRRDRLANPVHNATANAKRRADRAADPAPYREAARLSRLNNLERERLANRKYAARNAEAKRLATAAWRVANPEREKQAKVRYRAENLPAILARNKKRKAEQLMAMPQWFDATAAEAVYAGAKRLEAMVGRKMHVDHIVPLKSPVVCGLHWHGNLQVLDGAENVRKQNRHWPDMPDLATDTLEKAMRRLK